MMRSAGMSRPSGDFDPSSDGLDFYESLESMLVRVDEPIAVSGTSPRRVIAIVGMVGSGRRLHPAPRVDCATGGLQSGTPAG